uniref:Uncharacterized protein n=1 Tax=Parascaris equorum TaxID=6256 RepID=A0A914RD79_PAREQ
LLELENEITIIRIRFRRFFILAHHLKEAEIAKNNDKVTYLGNRISSQELSEVQQIQRLKSLESGRSLYMPVSYLNPSRISLLAVLQKSLKLKLEHGLQELYWRPQGSAVIFGDRFIEDKKRLGFALCAECGILEQRVGHVLYEKFSERKTVETPITKDESNTK